MKRKAVRQPGNAFQLSALTVLLSLTACGGGGGTSTPQLPAPTAPPVATPPPTAQCENSIYPFASSTDDGQHAPSLGPGNAIDGDTASLSRWSSNGVDRSLSLDLGETRTLGALTIKWFAGASRAATFSVETSTDNVSWTRVADSLESSGKHSGFELFALAESEARYVKIIGQGNSTDDNNGIIEVQAHKCSEATGQYAQAFPNEVGIDLADWYLSIPTDEDQNGRSDSIWENELAAGYTNSEFFYASSDNGIVMRSPSYGYKTSTNTKYVRVELREMLRRGDTSIRTQGVNRNNWVFGSASSQGQSEAGGVDGDLHVTLAVNQVTTTGEDYQIGRVVIGQIHANDDEPIRLYYRKLPGNSLGSVYFAHESRETDSDGDNIETYVEMIGSRSNSASNPENGIALDEKFSYHIQVNMNLLTVTLSREGQPDVVEHYDMSNSLYDQDGQYHYFKVGVYHLNNSSDTDEFAQATFYEIRNSHTGYGASE